MDAGGAASLAVRPGVENIDADFTRAASAAVGASAEMTRFGWQKWGKCRTLIVLRPEFPAARRLLREIRSGEQNETSHGPGGLLLTAALAQGQLRIVSLNGSNSDSPSNAEARDPWMSTILGAIGSSVSDDPTTAGNTGIAKPVDILCLQEVYSGSTGNERVVRGTAQHAVPGANYQYSTLLGATLPGMVHTAVHRALSTTPMPSHWFLRRRSAA